MATLEELETKFQEVQQEIILARQETRELAREKDEQIREKDRQIQELIENLEQLSQVSQIADDQLLQEKDRQIQELIENLEQLSQASQIADDQLQKSINTLQEKVKTNNLLVDSSVGIGTNNPVTVRGIRLDVRGNLVLDPNGNPTIFTGIRNSELNRYVNLINSTGQRSASGLKAGGILVSDAYNFANPSKNDLIVKGNVGIGKNNPRARLDVAGEIRGKLWFSNEFVLDVPSNGQTVRKKMLHSDKCAAFITSVRGEFKGGGERVWVEIRGDGFWYLCGHSQQSDVQVKARCIGMP